MPKDWTLPAARRLTLVFTLLLGLLFSFPALHTPALGADEPAAKSSQVESSTESKTEKAEEGEKADNEADRADKPSPIDQAAQQALDEKIKQLQAELDKIKAERDRQQDRITRIEKNVQPLKKKLDEANKAVEATVAEQKRIQGELDRAAATTAKMKKELAEHDSLLADIAAKLKLVRDTGKSDPSSAWTKAAPQDLGDLLAIQSRVQQVVERVLPTTVGLIVGNARGSGVIISADGYVLTAGHVSATPDRTVQVILHDGRVVRGKTLGRNTGIDSGLVKIESGDEWPFAAMGESKSLKQGDWCIAAGHPGGYQRGRPPVIRLGRIINANARVLWTDCTLVGGDSGGPLFDMEGKVIGIHSRISAPTTANFHVPVDTYHESWDRLVAGEDWNDSPINIGAVAGFHGENDDKGVRVTSVTEGGPANAAGLKVDDVITRFDGRQVRNANDIVAVLDKKKPSNQIKVEVLRDGKKTELNVTLVPGAKAGPFLGITGSDHEKGAGVLSIVPGTPAERAKLAADDVITRADGKEINNLAQLQGVLGKKKAGDEVDLEVLRGDKTLKLKLRLGVRG